MSLKSLAAWQRLITPLIALVVFLSAWEISVRALSVSPLILPPPSAVGSILTNQFGSLISQAGITLLESVLGFLLGCVAAFALATLFIFSRIAEQALYPYAIALKAIPLVALAPIVVIWFGTGLFSKVFLAAVIAFFPILVNAIDGLKAIEPEALELLKMLSASQWQVFTKLRIYTALPSIFAGMKVASSFAVVGAVVAEFISSDQGIGFVIKSSSYYLNTDLTFAAIIVSALIGLIFFWLISFLETKIIFWKSKSESSSKVKLRADNLIKQHLQHKGDYSVPFKGIKLRLKQGVFCAAYADGSDLLADCLQQEVRPNETVLDMGTGSGALAILAARKGGSVVAVDISSIAVECAKENARLNNLQEKVDVRQSNLFEAIRTDERFSLILFNPPFMDGQPSSPLEVSMYDKGYSTLSRFFEEFPNHLTPNGRLLIVFSESGDVSYLKKLMTSSGFYWSLLDSMVPDHQLAVLVYELRSIQI
jgi:NitT/TauT family transport system permease protein